jgi:hypothetical protein
MKRIAFCCAAGLAVVLPACGSLDSNTSSAPTLATLTGSLVESSSAGLSSASASAVRVAVIWRGDGPGRFNVAEDLPVQPGFPASFTIAFDAPPPAAAMNSEDDSTAPPQTSSGASGATPSTGAGGPPESDGGLEGDATSSASLVLLDTPLSTSAAGRYAVGTVVAYLDQNHNGKLDLVGDNATAYVDQILAANSEMSIAYFEGPIPDHSPDGVSLVDSAGHRPEDGYNLVNVPACNLRPPMPVNPECPSAAPPASEDAGPCAPIEWLGIDTTYPLTIESIDSSPAVASLMCLTPYDGPTTVGGSGTGAAPDVQPAQYPSPSDPNLCCFSDGSGYIYSTCMTVSQGLCKGTVEDCTSIGYSRPTPAPAAWPCAN